MPAASKVVWIFFQNVRTEPFVSVDCSTHLTVLFPNWASLGRSGCPIPSGARSPDRGLLNLRARAYSQRRIHRALCAIHHTQFRATGVGRQCGRSATSIAQDIGTELWQQTKPESTPQIDLV